jgi:outer membrane receptor protein involved in Fe transport
MNNPKLSYAIAAILSGSSFGLGVAHAAAATDTSDSEAIQEITVTAQRRSESIEDVPITIQAITGDTLKQLNVTTFDDLLRYTPNVTYSGNGPGLGNIFMRGLSSGGSGNQSQSTTAPFPNVGVYLDDESMQFPARNVDVYMVDMERVEVLEGPQGTLFGGGAQAGAIRYITNKPKLDVTEGNVSASYGTTAGGDPNSSVNATINLPLIADTLAVRATIFDDHRGGYISNVPGTISFPGSPSANNAALVGSNENPVTYTGVRLQALLQFNEDWNLLLSQNYQNMEADISPSIHKTRMALIWLLIRSPPSNRPTTRITTKAPPGRSMADSRISSASTAISEPSTREAIWSVTSNNKTTIPITCEAAPDSTTPARVRVQALAPPPSRRLATRRSAAGSIPSRTITRATKSA